MPSLPSNSSHKTPINQTFLTLSNFTEIFYFAPSILFQICTICQYVWLTLTPGENCCIQKYSGQHFAAFGLNTERYSVSLRIQSECGKMQTRITPDTDTFYAVRWLFSLMESWIWKLSWWFQVTYRGSDDGLQSFIVGV